MSMIALGLLAVGKWYYIVMVGLLLALLIVWKVLKGRQT